MWLWRSAPHPDSCNNAQRPNLHKFGSSSGSSPADGAWQDAQASVPHNIVLASKSRCRAACRNANLAQEPRCHCGIDQAEVRPQEERSCLIGLSLQPAHLCRELLGTLCLLLLILQVYAVREAARRMYDAYVAGLLVVCQPGLTRRCSEAEVHMRLPEQKFAYWPLTGWTGLPPKKRTWRTRTL